MQNVTSTIYLEIISRLNATPIILLLSRLTTILLSANFANFLKVFSGFHFAFELLLYLDKTKTLLCPICHPSFCHSIYPSTIHQSVLLQLNATVLRSTFANLVILTSSVIILIETQQCVVMTW